MFANVLGVNAQAQTQAQTQALIYSLMHANINISCFYVRIFSLLSQIIGINERMTNVCTIRTLYTNRTK